MRIIYRSNICYLALLLFNEVAGVKSCEIEFKMTSCPGGIELDPRAQGGTMCLVITHVSQLMLRLDSATDAPLAGEGI